MAKIHSPSLHRRVRRQNMPQFCHNFRNLSSSFDGLESGERVCIDIAIPRLFACAENGCSICSIIQSGVKIFDNGWIAENKMSPEPYELTVKAGLGKPMRVLWGMDPLKGALEFHTYAALRIFGAASRIDPSSGSAYTIKRVTGWIQDCIERHPQCAANTLSRLPTRVINVSNIKALESVFLYESEGRSGRYTALSHCWGKMQIIRTTKATIEQMKQGIPWASLSKTFQDAITLTRNLGVQYIWIDSLCIVQDDKYDWETESATMAAVYQNAYLTIAASLAADGSGGCFSTRENKTHFVGFLNDVEGLRNYSVHVRESFFHNEFSTDNTGIATLSNPLLGRAWTFQERGLSTRVLHFGRAELLWECRTTNDCECGRYKSIAAKLHIPHNLTELRERASSVGDVSEYVQLQWEAILSSYSAKKLTVSTDKLPAISAIASQFNTFAIAGKYLAGLWSCHLPSGLLWKVPKASRVKNIETPDDNYIAYSAPTWSWASVHDAAVDYSEDLVTLDFATLGSDLRINAHIVGFDCAASGANPFGEVTPGAQITIAGLATWANTVGFTDHDEALAAIRGSIGIDWEYGGKWPWKLEKRSTISSGESDDDNNDAQYSRVVDYFPDHILHPASVTSSSSSLLTTTRRLLCLKVITAQRHIFALVLRPLSEADGYHRVGLLEMLRADEKGDEGTSWHWFDDGAKEMVVKIL